MSIIASIVLAAATSLSDLVSGIDFAPIEKTEYGGTPSAACMTNEPAVVTNELTIEQKVEILWAAHTNRIAIVEARKENAEKRKSAIEQVRENARKRKSKLGKSSGGVK